MSADTPPPPERPTPKELDQRAEALKKKIDKHLGRGAEHDGGDPPCAEYQKYTELREQARQAGDYRAAADYELLRRRHPTHEAPHAMACWGLPT
ncbi:hypothetical protein [Streptomyces sp. BRA346]|uniref:hypothetical protein n=1 Tax=Streptomyces sp. BRA346 TaxID=2878199 RepID=UPI004062D5C1